MIDFATGVGTDPFRYIYVLNYTDQTVSVIDTNSDTVTATITLSASKALRNIVYRTVSKSVYVLTNNWWDRIDADPSSGTFNTVVDSGSLTSNTSLNFATYIPLFDCLGYCGVVTGRGLIRFNSTDGIDSGETASATAQETFMKSFPEVKSGNITLQPPLPAAASPFQIWKSGYLVATQPTISYQFKMIPLGGNQYSLIDRSPRTDFAQLGYPCKIGRFITGHRSTGFYAFEKDSLAILPNTLTVSPNDRISHKYTPAGSRIFIYRKINTNVNLSVIDWPTLTDLGDIDRTAYKATNESCTRQAIYSPFSKKLYVLGGNTAASGTVDKVHVYDPTQVLGSMYISSITVGNSGTAPVDYFETAMCMNGIEVSEFDDPAQL